MTLHTKELIEKTKGLSHEEFMEYLCALSTIAQTEQHVKITFHEDAPPEPSRWKLFAEELRNDQDRNDPEFKEAWSEVKKGANEIHQNFSL